MTKGWSRFMATNDSITKFFISKQWKGGFFWCPSHRKSHRKGTDSMFILRSLVSSGTLLGWITMKYYLQYMIYISCISEIIYQFFSIFTTNLQLYTSTLHFVGCRLTRSSMLENLVFGALLNLLLFSIRCTCLVNDVLLIRLIQL